MQFQSDVLGVEIARPELVETTALGAAFLAGLGTGVWKDHDAVSADLARAAPVQADRPIARGSKSTSRAGTPRSRRPEMVSPSSAARRILDALCEQLQRPRRVEAILDALVVNGTFHVVHLGRYALGGFGLVFVEATGVSRSG